MALLDAGVDISVIALWLGHESIETTNGYLHTSIALKEKALAKVTPSGSAFKRFQPDDSLLAFLASI
jgi:site-specific recombinase XerD